MKKPTEPTDEFPTVKRARPLLGTFVEIGVGGLPAPDAHAAIEAGFSAIADIHRLMSFHEPDSDLGRMNRDAFAAPVRVDLHTFAVLRQAQELAAASGGVFDITVAASLVDWGFLPRPESSRDPDPEASWRDIELIAPDRVRFRRALWVDLGGIAKGYAVDHAAERMALSDTVQSSINAGGDLRIAGPRPERVLLRAPTIAGGLVPVVEIQNASLASSSGRENKRRAGGQLVGPHLDASRGRSVGTRSFVSVIADRCAIADALTKIVLARRAGAAGILRKYGATAYLRDGRGTWRTLGTTA
jgi:thiamine biosynthesis lipoprotein